MTTINPERLAALRAERDLEPVQRLLDALERTKRDAFMRAMGTHLAAERMAYWQVEALGNRRGYGPRHRWAPEGAMQWARDAWPPGVEPVICNEQDWLMFCSGVVDVFERL